MFARVLLFGYGSMAAAMLEGWLGSGLSPASFTVYNPRPKQVPDGVAFTSRLPAERFDAVVLGVKPQTLGDVSREVASLAGAGTVLISVLAAVDLDRLAVRFPNAGALVRMMPNLAAAIGKSPVALAGRGLGGVQHACVTDLARRLGSAEWLKDEAQFDIVTALAGSGPGFVYRFIDALAGGATELGLDRALAERMARQMVAGAAALAADSVQSPGELARRVASPGGTTQAGLDALDEESGLQQLIARCLRATRDRERTLSVEVNQ